MVIRCVKRPCVTHGPVFFHFVMFRIIMEIWDFCLEISLKNHWNFSRLVSGNPEMPWDGINESLLQCFSNSQMNVFAFNSIRCFFKVLHVWREMVLKPKYSGITRTNTMAADVLASPDHQQPWHWLCKINMAFFLHEKGFLCLFYVKEW